MMKFIFDLFLGSPTGSPTNMILLFHIRYLLKKKKQNIIMFYYVCTIKKVKNK